MVEWWMMVSRNIYGTSISMENLWLIMGMWMVNDGYNANGVDGRRSVEHVLRRRLALVLTQRGANWNSSSTGDTGEMEMGTCSNVHIFGNYWKNRKKRNSEMETKQEKKKKRCSFWVILMKFPAPCAKSDCIFLGLTNCARDLTRLMYLCARDWFFFGVCDVCGLRHDTSSRNGDHVTGRSGNSLDHWGTALHERLSRAWYWDGVTSHVAVADVQHGAVPSGND